MKRQTILQLAILAALVLTINPAFAGRIIYVDDDVTGVKDGSSWANAYKYLQDALAAAYSGDEIRVAQGIYKPDKGTRITPRDREATFQLKNGVTVKGGYAGFGQPNPEACDVDLYETILTGDLNGDDGPNFADNADNSYHVVTGTGTDETAVLDAFTITGGNATDGSGGGMYNYDGRPTLINCTFSNNSAGNKGGGVYSHDTYEMTLINCRFSGNSAGEDGGGMACWYNYNNSPTLTNCIFSGNSAGNKGGGMSFVESEPVLSNCSFSGNSAGNKGGGIYMNFWYGYPVLTNCVLWGNSDFAGMGESAQINTDSYGPPVINYICVQGWTSHLGGIGNIGADPCFVEPGYWDANGVWVDGDYHLLQDSPCIDAGDPNYIAEPDETDLDGKPRVIGGRIDMGAYESQYPRIIYVDDDAAGANDGSSWADAYNYLQDALAAANDVDEIRVAQGTYKPDQGVGFSPEDDTATFQLINSVTLNGGYAGAGTPDSNARDIDLYESILSGEISDDEDTLHVVCGSGTDKTAVLDGFTITGGDAWGSNNDSFGGGMYNYAGSPTVRNCTFIENLALNYGGGMCNDGNSCPTLINCVFKNNSATDGGGMDNEYSNPTLINCTFIANSACSYNADGGFGGGMYNFYSNSTLIDCTFTENSSDEWGGAGGMCNNNSSVIVTNSTFINNSGGREGGGGMYNIISNPTLKDCTFKWNSALDDGGGMYNWDSSPSLINCRFLKNSADHGGGMDNFESDPTLLDCLFTGNSATENGGAVCNEDSPAIFVNCEFSSNSAGKNGGGMYNHLGIYNLHVTQTLFNCTFSGNFAGENGGGMCNISLRLPLLTNCTFGGNMANGAGGGIHASGGCIYYKSDIPQILNCILWGDTAAYGDEISLVPLSILYPSGASLKCASRISVGYSNVQGGPEAVYVQLFYPWGRERLKWLEGNIDSDPCFVYPGYWDANGLWIDGDYHLLEGSPCIDAGDPNYVAEPNETDLDGKPRVIGGRIDMGAYEYSPPIPAEVRIVPRTINLTSKGNWITVFLWLPEEYNVADIDPNSVLLEGEIKPEEFSVDQQKQVAVLRFSREDVQPILEVGDIDLTIIGRLTDGTAFDATDTIKVIDKARKK